MKLTAAKHKQIKKIAAQTGVSEEALIELEHVKQLIREGGTEALVKEGYSVHPDTSGEAV